LLDSTKTASASAATTPPPGVKPAANRDPAAPSGGGASPPPPAASGAKAGAKPPADPAMDAKKREMEASKAREKEQQAQEQAVQKKQNCESAQGALRTLESGQRIARVGTDGERYFLDEQQIVAAKPSARATSSEELQLKPPFLIAALRLHRSAAKLSLASTRDRKQLCVCAHLFFSIAVVSRSGSTPGAITDARSKGGGSDASTSRRWPSGCTGNPGNGREGLFAGPCVDAASGLSEAFEKLRATPPIDLVILDPRLPGYRASTRWCASALNFQVSECWSSRRRRR
jgi:hypothetical protein